MRFFSTFSNKTKLESSRKHLVKSKKLKIKSVAIMLVHKYLDRRNIFVNPFCTLLKYGAGLVTWSNPRTVALAFQEPDFETWYMFEISRQNQHLGSFGAKIKTYVNFSEPIVYIQVWHSYLEQSQDRCPGFPRAGF